MIDGIGKLGAYLVLVVLYIVPIALGGWIADVVTKKLYPPPPDDFRGPYKEKWGGCLIPGLAFVLVTGLAMFVLHPSVEALKRITCEGDRHFADCMGWE